MSLSSYSLSTLLIPVLKVLSSLFRKLDWKELGLAVTAKGEIDTRRGRLRMGGGGGGEGGEEVTRKIFSSRSKSHSTILDFPLRPLAPERSLSHLCSRIWMSSFSLEAASPFQQFSPIFPSKT